MPLCVFARVCAHLCVPGSVFLGALGWVLGAESCQLSRGVCVGIAGWDFHI